MPNNIRAANRGKMGYTIVELAIASVIAVIAISALFAISIMLQENIALSTGILNITQKGRFVMDRISHDIREAKVVSPSYATYTTDNDTLILNIPSIDASGDIIDPENIFDTVIYTQDQSDPKILYRIVYANVASSRNDVTETLSKNTDSIGFSSLGTGMSGIADKSTIKSVTVTSVTAGTFAGFSRLSSIISSASLRNKKTGP